MLYLDSPECILGNILNILFLFSTSVLFVFLLTEFSFLLSSMKTWKEFFYIEPRVDKVVENENSCV